MIINLIGLSGGKDSTALWAWALNESGYPVESIRGVACDTQNEYDEVYEQIAALDAYGQLRGVSPVVILHSEGFLNLAIRKGRFPSARARFCTEELKIKPTTTVPESQRSALYVRKDGKQFRVATIDDVARWSFTLRGGVQGGFDFMFDDSPIYEVDDAHHPCKSGYCE